MEPLKTKEFVSQAEWNALFGNIDTLYKVNGALLGELKANPENVAAAFLKLAPYFKLYSVYAYDYKQIVSILQVCVLNAPVNGTYLLSTPVVSFIVVCWFSFCRKCIVTIQNYLHSL